jgi:CheY-like chemotaxis protein
MVLYVQKSAKLPFSLIPITAGRQGRASLHLFTTCSPTMQKLAAYCQSSPFEANGRLHNPLLLRPSSLSFSPSAASSGLHITSSCYKRQKRRLNKKFGSLFAIDDDVNGGLGSYIDLGSTINEYSNIDAIFQNVLPVSQQHSTTKQPPPSNNSNNDNNWRSKHWIVLIDDESSIRLAIGDYLHSMGYTMITACDGPSSFLDVLLYSCGWSFLSSSDGGVGGGKIGDNIPPWIIDYDNSDDDGSNGSSNRMLWRLPNCIISDIRMPGGVDGVQLLQLLRQQRQQLKTQSPTMGRQSPKNKKKGRERKMQKKKSDDENEYDGKDDFELLDAIVGNGGSGSGGDEKNDIDRRRIVTAIDQANQKLDVISDTLAYHQEANNNEQQLQQQQYPNSLDQIPVILLTAKAMVSDRIVGYRAGANNYLPKPFRPEELLGMVDSLMRKQERERRGWMIGRSSMSDLDGSGQADLADTGERSNNANILQSYSASAQQLNDLKTELMEIKNLLKEETMQQNKAKVELEEVEGLTRLLPEAIWMFMNGERRKRLFTSDHIRSILKFCFDGDSSSLPKKGIMKRDDLLEELERMNEEYPDRVQDYISIS